MSTFDFTFTNETTVAVNHGLGDEHPFWILYDVNGEYILPTSAVATSEDVFTFTFDAATSGAGTILSVLDLVTLGSAQAFTDLTTVKQALGLAANDSSEDATLTRLIAGVSEAMKSYMRREIVETAHSDEVYNGNGKDRIVLSSYPVVAASGVAVTIDGSAWDSSNFVVDYDAGILQGKPAGNTFEKGIGNVKVTYVSGYSGGVPQDLNLACVKQVLYERRLQNNRHTIGLSTSSIVGVSFEAYRSDEWAQGVKQTLDRYRRGSLG